MLDVLGPRHPGVDLEHADLHQGQERGQIVDDQVLADLGLLGDPHPAQRVGRAHVRVLHVEAAPPEIPSGQRTSVSGRPARCGSTCSAIRS